MLITRHGIQGASHLPVSEQFTVPTGTDYMQFLGMEGNICWQSLSARPIEGDFQI